MVMFSDLPCLSWKWKSSEKGDDYAYGITPNELLQVDTKWMYGEKGGGRATESNTLSFG